LRAFLPLNVITNYRDTQQLVFLRQKPQLRHWLSPFGLKRQIRSVVAILVWQRRGHRLFGNRDFFLVRLFSVATLF